MAAVAFSLQRLRAGTPSAGPHPGPMIAWGAAAYHPASPAAGNQPMARALEPLSTPFDSSGPQPVDALIHRALAENRTVQAAYQ